ncbi:MAG TPA: serine/threonine-protein kinase [Nannocystaceae bacterium]|nr:serine/threonine-protein kinase [Nannocystaceae bacterium]
MSEEISAVALPAGAKLGRYQVLRRIAVGGMAELYLARNVGRAGFEKLVAIKRVRPHLAEDGEFVQMFLDEARLAAGLEHSGIASVFDFGSSGREHFMAMEYVHGKNVRDILKAGDVPIACALTILKQVAAALHYAHERCGADGLPLGLVHRDVSPSNILVSWSGDVKLCDFGIAKATTQSSATRTGTIKGKLSYMAPEQIRGETVDRRADVFALGIVAYELCTGKRCFYASGEFALINRVAAGKFEKPSSAAPGFPTSLERVLLDALAVEADARTPTARALQEAIEEYASTAGIRLSSTVLSDYMRERFTAEAYPTVDTLPSQAESTAPTMAPRRTSTRARKRGMWWRVSGALAAGLALGLGVQRLFAGDPVREEPRVEAEPAAIVPTNTAGAAAVPVPPPAPAEVVDEDEDDAVILDDSDASATKPGKRARTRKPARSAATPAPARTPSSEYLPPSRRGG